MLVDRLERGGWVRRSPHPSDRRAVLLELAEKAPGAVPPGLARYHARIARLTGEVPREHREALGSFLRAAAAAAADAARELQGRVS